MFTNEEQREDRLERIAENIADLVNSKLTQFGRIADALERIAAALEQNSGEEDTTNLHDILAEMLRNM